MADSLRWAFYLACIFAIVRAHSAEPAIVLEQSWRTVVIRDASGAVVEVPKAPRRVVVLANSVLDVWYLAGGEAIARVTGSENVPAAAMQLPSVGGAATPNPEIIVALQPDLVISTDRSSSRELAPLLRSARIPQVMVSYRTFAEFLQLLELFAIITEQSANPQFQQRLHDYRESVAQVVRRFANAAKPRVAIIASRAMVLRCETSLSIAGSMIADLGAHNIVDGMLAADVFYVPLDMERLIVADPDVLLFSTFGDRDQALAGIEARLANDSLWKNLRAVRTGRAVMLPEQYCHFRPNDQYPQAYAYLAEILFSDN